MNITYKVALVNNYIVITSDDLPDFLGVQGPAKNVTILPTKEDAERFEFWGLDNSPTMWDELNLNQILDSTGTPFTLESWTTFYTTNTGNFNTAPGGSGANSVDRWSKVEQPSGFSHDLGYLQVIRPVGGTAEIVNFNKDTLRKKLDAPVIKYVDQINGLDTNTGDTWAQAYKTFTKLRTVSFDRAFCAKGNYASLSNPMFTTENEIISVGGNSTLCFGFIGTERTWVSVGSGTFSNSITAVVTVVLDTSKFDSDGDYFRLTPLASLVDVQATPDSFWKDSGTNTLYVHYADGLTPSRASAVMSISEFLHTAGYNNYREGIDYIGGFRATSTTSLSTVNNVNCSYLFHTSINGFTTQGNVRIYQEKCRSGKNFLDGFNYHKSSTFNPMPIEYKCIGYKNGENNTTSINNGSTTHEEVKILRVGCIYFENEGPNVHDVNTAMSWNVDCVAYDSVAVNPDNRSNFALGASVAETCEMWLDGCVTHIDVDTFGAEDRAGLNNINVRNCSIYNVEPGTVLTNY